MPRGGRVSTTGRESVACAVMESAPVADLSVDTAAVTAGVAASTATAAAATLDQGLNLRFETIALGDLLPIALLIFLLRCCGRVAKGLPLADES